MNNNLTEKIEAIIVAAEVFLPKCDYPLFKPEMHDCNKLGLWHTFGWEGEEYIRCDEHKKEDYDLNETAFELWSAIENYKKYCNRVS